MFATLGRLALIGTTGGLLAGIIAAIQHQTPALPEMSLIGAAVGLGTTPLLFETIHGKRLKHALPWVYLPSFALQLVCGAFFNSRSAIVAWASTFAFMTLVAAIFLPHRSRSLPGHCCFDCGYDMTSNSSGRCPECAALWTGAPPLIARDLFPWRTRAEAFLCWWSGCFLSLILSTLFGMFAVATLGR